MPTRGPLEANAFSFLLHPDVRRGSECEQVPRCCGAVVPLPRLHRSPYALPDPEGKAGEACRQEGEECPRLRSVNPDPRRWRDQCEVLRRRESDRMPLRHEPIMARRPEEACPAGLRAEGGQACRPSGRLSDTSDPYAQNPHPVSACRPASPALPGRGTVATVPQCVPVELTCHTAYQHSLGGGSSRVAPLGVAEPPVNPTRKRRKPLPPKLTISEAPGSGASIGPTMKRPLVLLRIGHEPVFPHFARKCRPPASHHHAASPGRSCRAVSLPPLGRPGEP